MNIAVVYVSGVPIPVEEDGTVALPDVKKDEIIVSYSINNAGGENVHTQYPTSMTVWVVKEEPDGTKTAERIPELDNILQYAGMSIRFSGKKGIRMITSIPSEAKKTLVDAELAGYTLEEYGTLVAWDSELNGDALVLGHSAAKSNYAYKRGVADPVFAQSNGLTQYTNVLVGFTLEQCKPDLAMRPYMLLKNAEGDTITLYGGTVHRSIGYIAYQNRNAFTPGTEAYEYIWEMIHYVYGDIYDAEYIK